MQLVIGRTPGQRELTDAYFGPPGLTSPSEDESLRQLTSFELARCLEAIGRFHEVDQLWQAGDMHSVAIQVTPTEWSQFKQARKLVE
jgi:hypothetical protein